MPEAPHMRMFAGPNGSGKSTIRPLLPSQLLGLYVNPDEIQKALDEEGSYDLVARDVNATRDEVVDFFASSTLMQRNDVVVNLGCISVTGGRLMLEDPTLHAYGASVIADFVRHKLIKAQVLFIRNRYVASREG